MDNAALVGIVQARGHVLKDSGDVLRIELALSPAEGHEMRCQGNTRHVFEDQVWITIHPPAFEHSGDVWVP